MATLIERARLAVEVLRGKTKDGVQGQVADPTTAPVQWQLGTDGEVIPTTAATQSLVLTPGHGDVVKALEPMNRPSAPSQKAPDNGSFMMFPSWMNGQPQWQFIDLAAYVSEGFEMNTLIYSAVMYKARAAVSAPLRAYTGDIENPTRLPPAHPLARLLHRPNPHQSWAEFTQQQITYLNLSGNSFTYLQRTKDGAFPIALWNLRPDFTYIVPGDGKKELLKGYLFRPYGVTTDNGLPIVPADMMHVKFPNPGDLLMGLGYGLSPLTPLAQSGDVDNEVTRFLKMFFENKAMIGGLLKYETSLNDTMVAEARQRWQEIYGGVDNWGAVAVLDKSASYQRIGLTFEEMGFASLDERNETRILSPFGVPAILIGAGVGLKYGTYSNFETARRAFWEDTFVAELKLFESDYQYYLSSEDGSFPVYDTSGVPALQKNVPTLVSAAKTMFDMGTPRDIAYRTVGLNVPETVDGHVGYLPFGLQPVGAPRTTAPDGAPTETVIEASTTDDSTPSGTDVLPNATEEGKAAVPRPETQTVKKNRWNEEQRTLIWKAVDKLAQSHEAPFQKAAKKAFEGDKRAILALITDAKQKALQRKASIDWRALIPAVGVYLANDSVPAWQSTFVPVVTTLATDVAQYWGNQLGMNVPKTMFRDEWFESYTLKFAQPISDTSRQSLAALLEQAATEGWSVPTMQSHMTTLFDQWMDGDVSPEDFEFAEQRMPAYRTEMIGRTESIRASNAAAEQTYDAFGIRSRSWLSTQDDRTRDTHLEADGQSKPLGESFRVGGYDMDYPGDASHGAPPSEFINCRCTTIPDVE